MKIICQKEDLLNGIQAVQRVVSSKTTIPILTGIHISAHDGRLTFKTTDLEIGLEKKVAVDVVVEGAIVLSAKYFSEIVRKLPDMPLTLESNEKNSLLITYGSSNIKINGFDPDEFPLMTAINSESAISIPQNILKTMIRQVVVALSDDEMRPVFTGVFIEVKKDGNICLVATDTHRLAFRQGVFTGEISSDCTLIVPGKTMIELMKSLSDNEDPIEINFNENQIYFKREDFSLISRLIEGQFPAYRQILPTQFETTIIFNNNFLTESIDRAALMVREDAKKSANVIKLGINNEEQKIIIEANSADIGQLYEEIPVEIQGNSMEIAFNSKYLLDALRVLGEEKGAFKLSGPVNPGIIKTLESEDFMYLILPVRNA